MNLNTTLKKLKELLKKRSYQKLANLNFNLKSCVLVQITTYYIPLYLLKI